MSDRTRPPELSIIVFAYNEAENVEPVLRELCDWLDLHEPASEILFVDDGSSDQTASVAARALDGRAHRILEHGRNRGIGAAIKTGVRAASGEWATFLPADGQIEPQAIGVLRAAAQPGVDVVFSVYDNRNDGLDRKVLSWGVRALIRVIHGVRMRSDGPYLFKTRLFDPEALPPDSFFLNFEFPIRVLAQGCRTAEVVIRCRPRRAGFSKSAGLRTIAVVGKELLALRARRLLG